MAKPKIYLSPAAHATDNATKCPSKCGENVHCIAYCKLLKKRLEANGYAVKIGSTKKTGSAALKARVKEANKWGAKRYNAVHTNSGGGRYSMTMCWPDAASRAEAEVVHKHRKCVSSHKVVTTRDLYEINQTAMTCLYDELFFHDNAEDCAWFHNGGMEKLVEETVQAYCEMDGLTYKPEIVLEKPKHEAAKPTAPKGEVEKPAAPKAGDVVKLNKGRLYTSSTGTKAYTKTGTYYLYDGQKISGRYRVTNKKNRVGKTPVGSNVSGWVKLG